MVPRQLVALALTATLLVSLLPELANAHGCMNYPNQRGALGKSKFVPKGVDDDAPKDHWMHFPAGNKDAALGAGLRSQKAGLSKRGWLEFTPTEPGYHWPTGVCGDQKGKPQEHMRGGKYYYDGKIVKTYTQGGILSVSISVIAHHNGYMVMHSCDVSKCGGEISESCFKKGHCKVLKRAKNKECDSGKSKRCGPIDRDHPERWYLPCSTVGESGWEIYGPETIQFELPERQVCKHCVLHWYWTSANSCNPPGVVEYFDGPDAPDWGSCKGQGGALGGVTRVQKPCGGFDKVPEEYHQCADIAIESAGRDRSAPRKPETESAPLPSPSASPMPTPSASATPVSATDIAPSTEPDLFPEMSSYPSPDPYTVDEKSGEDSGPAPRTGEGVVIESLVLVGDGEVVQTIGKRDVIDVSMYEKISIEAVTTRKVPKVEFFINDKSVWNDYNRPYFMYGNTGRVPRYWNEPIVNKRFKLRVEADGDVYQVRITLRK